MEAPRAPAPRLRPSPLSTDASTSSHHTLPASLIGSPRPILNLLRPSVIQSPSEFIFSPPALPLVSRTNDGTPRSRSQKYTELASLLSGNMPQTPTSDEAYQSKQSTSSDRLPQFSQTRISGEVALTPTYSSYAPSHSSGIVQNPHSTMIAQTPVAANLAKNSIKLQNCVSTVNLKCELKLLDIYCRTRFSEYNPSRFHGVVMKILEPRATALVFRSGKLVCTGARNEHDSLLATKKFSRVIQKLGFPVKFTEFKIQNLVATADLRFPIKLEALQQAHGQFTSYEPELFPGLIYRMIRPRIVLLIFVNGKIVFTGGKSREDISESLNIIYPILKSFKKN